MTRPTGTHTLAAVLRLPVALLAAALSPSPSPCRRPRRRCPARSRSGSRSRQARGRKARSPSTPPCTCPPPRLHPPCWSPTGSAVRRPRWTPTPARLPTGVRRALRGRRAGSAPVGADHANSPDHEVADARALVDRLAARPEVVQDGPGDPRVGVTGGSRRRGAGPPARGLRPAGGRAGADDHVERPGPGLFPNAAGPGTLPADTPARGAFAPDGVFKRGWAGCSSRRASPWAVARAGRSRERSMRRRARRTTQ